MGGRQQEAGKEEPQEGQQPKQLARLLPGKVDRKAERVGDCRENPHLPDRGKGR